MKKTRQARHFLDELQKTPVVSAVCSKLNLSRQTIYRWIKEDPEFKKEYEACLSSGIDNINDLAESQLIKKIQTGDIRAVTYWLENNKTKYYKPKKAIPAPRTERIISTVKIQIVDEKGKPLNSKPLESVQENKDIPLVRLKKLPTHSEGSKSNSAT